MQWFKQLGNRIVPAQSEHRAEDAEQNKLVSSLKDNLQKVEEKTGKSEDVIIREFRIGVNGGVKAAILYTEGLIDTKSSNQFILEPLMLESRKNGLGNEALTGPQLLQWLKDTMLTVVGMQEVNDFDKLYYWLFTGGVVLLVDGYTQGFALCMNGWEARSVEEPATESVVRGPREGFTENINTNISLIRKKIKDPNLWLESKLIGQVTQTKVSFMYINGIANENVVKELKNRLDRIKIDAIFETSNIEELIQDETYTPFPTVFNSERPDVIAANLLEGKVAIFVDGTPFVLIVPALFVSFFHAAEDYYQRADFATLLRFLRYLGVIFALTGPSFYIAVTTFHQEMLPTQLLISLAAQREGVPFPAFIEAIMMEVTFEILREASLKMPRAIGQAVSVVGTLVIGQAAVEAGIVSAGMVIVVAITAIANLMFPAINMSIAIRMLRFPLMLLAASFGIFGIIMGLIFLALHLCSLRSFGVPYMSSLAPFILENQKDTIFRFPQWALRTRPHSMPLKDNVRANNPAPQPGLNSGGKRNKR